jgi:hypothetical protein
MAERHVWRSRIGSVAAAALLMAHLTTAADASSTGDKVAAGVAGAVVGGLIGAAIANSDKNRAPGYYPQPYAPQPAPGYYPPPPQYNSNTAWQTCLAYGNKYSQRGGALGLRLDNLISVRPIGYNSYQVSAYVSVLWPGYQTRTHVTCTVTNGTVTSWLVA